MKTEAAHALSIATLALAVGCTRTDISLKAHEAPREPARAHDSDTGEGEGPVEDDDSDGDHEDEGWGDEDSGLGEQGGDDDELPPDGPFMCPDTKAVMVDGQCWEVRSRGGESCSTTDIDIEYVGVSLKECVRLCEDSYPCMYERHIGYDRETQSCWLAPWCVAESDSHRDLEYLGCVTGEGNGFRWREQPSIDECDGVHPSWTVVEGVDMLGCIALCEQHEDCGRWRMVQYRESTGSCILDASCSPTPDGFAEFVYETHPGCILL